MAESGLWTMLNAQDPAFILGALLVAIAYSAVGHGGAAGYPALRAFTPMAPSLRSGRHEREGVAG